MLKSAIDENSNYLGAWTLWESNAFDGRDQFYISDTLYNDKGSIGIGYFRSRDSIYYEVMTAKDYQGDYFIYPKELGTAFLTEPYRFVYSGYKQVFFGATVSVPIINQGEFLGTIGVDIDLGSLQAELDKVRPYKDGYLSLISNKGTIITHIDSSFVTKNISNIINKSDSLSNMAIVDGKELTYEVKSEFTGEKVFRMFYPIEIEELNNPWSMMIEIPLVNATYRSKQLLSVAIVTLLVGLSLLIYLIINISERRKYEKELLLAKNKAEESNRLKTAFLNNISHEIRTPLNGILGFAEMITSTDPLDEEIIVYKDMMEDSSKQLLTTVSNVIELSKIQAKESNINISEFELNEFLEKIKDSYNSIANEKQIDFLGKFPQDKSKCIIASDKEKISQVLTYLLNNAFKFTDKGSVEIGYEKMKDSYVFFVKDTGVGIKPENMKTIFNYFTQGDISSARKYDGLGVGLSISKSFITMLGGSIWLESEFNKGSTFYFSLPFNYKN